MTSVHSCAPPAGTFLDAYAQGGAYTDCYAMDLGCQVTQQEFVEAFYTTPLFKVERWLIARFLSRPSTDADARQLAAGTTRVFAAWSVEQYGSSQLMLATGRTRSWLMASPSESGSSATRLHFGSAVVPNTSADTGASSMGWQFRALLGFHRAYSRALLAAAARKLTAK
jgi:hypothetical protein